MSAPTRAPRGYEALPRTRREVVGDRIAVAIAITLGIGNGLVVVAMVAWEVFGQ